MSTTKGGGTLTGTATGATAALTGGPAVYTVSASGMTRTGTVIATIAAGKAQDTAGNLNVASIGTPVLADRSVWVARAYTPVVALTVGGEGDLRVARGARENVDGAEHPR